LLCCLQDQVTGGDTWQRVSPYQIEYYGRPAYQCPVLRDLILHRLQQQGISLTVRARQPCRHPWAGERIDPVDLPALYLTDHEELAATEAHWLARDTVAGFGTPPGIARFGQFLMDIGNPVTGGTSTTSKARAASAGSRRRARS
jgi:hypothetical protein